MCSLTSGTLERDRPGRRDRLACWPPAGGSRAWPGLRPRGALAEPDGNRALRRRVHVRVAWADELVGGHRPPRGQASIWLPSSIRRPTAARHGGTGRLAERARGGRGPMRPSCADEVRSARGCALRRGVGFKASRARVSTRLRDREGAVPARCGLLAGIRALARAGLLVDGAEWVRGRPGLLTGLAQKMSPHFSFPRDVLRLDVEEAELPPARPVRQEADGEGLFARRRRWPRPALQRAIGGVTGEGRQARDDGLRAVEEAGPGGWSGPSRRGRTRPRGDGDPCLPAVTPGGVRRGRGDRRGGTARRVAWTTLFCSATRR